MTVDIAMQKVKEAISRSHKERTLQSRADVRAAIITLYATGYRPRRMNAWLREQMGRETSQPWYDFK